MNVGYLQSITHTYGSKHHVEWSEMALNYWRMVERYPSIKEEVGGSTPDCEFSSLLDTKNLPDGQLPLALWRWPIGLLCV